MIKRRKQRRCKIFYEDIIYERKLKLNHKRHNLHWKYFNTWKREEMLFNINFNYRGVFLDE